LAVSLMTSELKTLVYNKKRKVTWLVFTIKSKFPIYFEIGLAKSKLCKPFRMAVSLQGTLFFMKFDHITSHVLHINSPGAISGFIFLTIK
jgi:hypothetical protein